MEASIFFRLIDYVHNLGSVAFCEIIKVTLLNAIAV